MRAALADLPCPVTDLRHCAKSDPAETQAAE
jgi:hypothetical protein